MAKRHFQLKVDFDDIARLAHDLRQIQGGADKALSKAVNKSLKGVKTDMTNETFQELALKKKRIRNDIKVTRFATENDPRGTVTTEGKPVNLAEFQATKTKKGVSFRIWRGEAKSNVKGLFFATVKDPKGNQHRLVFWRKKNTAEKEEKIGTKKRKPRLAYGKLPREYRLPIQARTGPRIQDITARDDVMRRIEESGRQRLKRELSHQVDRMLKRAKRT